MPPPQSRAHLVAAAAAAVVAVEEGAWEPQVEHVDHRAAADDVERKCRPQPPYTSPGSFNSSPRRRSISGVFLGVGVGRRPKLKNFKLKVALAAESANSGWQSSIRIVLYTVKDRNSLVRAAQTKARDEKLVVWKERENCKGFGKPDGGCGSPTRHNGYGRRASKRHGYLYSKFAGKRSPVPSSTKQRMSDGSKDRRSVRHCDAIDSSRFGKFNSPKTTSRLRRPRLVPLVPLPSRLKSIHASKAFRFGPTVFTVGSFGIHEMYIRRSNAKRPSRPLPTTQKVNYWKTILSGETVDGDQSVGMQAEEGGDSGSRIEDGAFELTRIEEGADEEDGEVEFNTRNYEKQSSDAKLGEYKLKYLG
ncbi:hypothetical protein R3P38DRAFT_3355049 [Favolaschia claudopus]|uniref:Uncharacterized protein n=1 Tax=Favolaschia claudopus TaxID=2862362 RepID=A0AAW0BL84_9AGAR